MRRLVNRLVLLTLVAGCGPPPRDGRIATIDHAQWREVTAAEDPFEDRPLEVDCSIVGFGTEELTGETTFSVDTRLCRYLTARQPLLTELRDGERLDLRFWHFELAAPEPTDAHLAVRIGEHVQWETTLSIPRPAGLVNESLAITEHVPAGEAVYFHVHNHGINSYNFVELTTGR